MKTFQTLIISSLLLLVISCGKDRTKYIKSPLDIIITTHIDAQNYSVILADMDYKEESDTYFHKYKIILEKKKNTTDSVEDDFDIKITDWKKVSPITFEEHQKDLGMTVLSKKNGVLDKKSTPAGYNNYVGNQKYGSWQNQSNGSSFWAFYGQYHFMSSLFYGSSHRYYRNDYNYYRTNHHGKSNFYGRNNNFGTSTYKSANSSWSSKPQIFKDKVRTNVKRSSSSLKAKGYSSSKSYKSSNRTKRNTNRYSSSSSSRSRSGGFGK
jgi:ribosomal protein S8